VYQRSRKSQMETFAVADNYLSFDLIVSSCRLILVEDIPLCLKYDIKMKLNMYSF